MLRRSIIIITNNPSHLGVITAERSLGRSFQARERVLSPTDQRERERERLCAFAISPHVDNRRVFDLTYVETKTGR